MTEANKTVVWYDYTHGFQMFFPNGYGFSIIPGYNGDTMEVTVVDGEGAAIPDNNGDTMEFVTPAMLGNYINRVRDLPPRTGCSPLAPDETIEGGVLRVRSTDRQPTVNIPKAELDALALALLDDDNGISENAYKILSKYISPSISTEVDATEGRFYLPSHTG